MTNYCSDCCDITEFFEDRNGRRYCTECMTCCECNTLANYCTECESRVCNCYDCNCDVTDEEDNLSKWIKDNLNELYEYRIIEKTLNNSEIYKGYEFYNFIVSGDHKDHVDAELLDEIKSSGNWYQTKEENEWWNLEKLTLEEVVNHIQDCMSNDSIRELKELIEESKEGKKDSRC